MLVSIPETLAEMIREITDSEQEFVISAVEEALMNETGNYDNRS